MPKPVQFTRESIINACIEIIRTKGSEGLSSRSICRKTGCSVAPLFRTFKNMEELIANVRIEVDRIFSEYMSGILDYSPAFKEFGMRMIRFAKEEPGLFRFLFLDIEGRDNVADTLARDCLVRIANQVTPLYRQLGINFSQAEMIYQQLWPFLCGIAQLSSRNPATYTEEYVSKLLSTQFQALATLIKTDTKVEIIDPYLLPEGERIYLRKWRHSDAERLFALASDPELGPRAGWLPHKDTSESLEVIKKYFQNDSTWAVISKESGQIIGCVGYKLPSSGHLPQKEGEAEVGYWMGRDFWGQGLCTEALGLVIEYCRQKGEIHTLWGEHFTDNPASGRVLEKCGFVDTAERTTCPLLTVGSDKEVRVMKLELL